MKLTCHLIKQYLFIANSMIQPTKILAAVIVCFALEGIICSALYNCTPFGILFISSFFILFIFISQLTIEYFLLEKKESLYSAFLVIWLLSTIYSMIIALALLIYLSELQQNEVNPDSHLIPLMVYNPKMSFSAVTWINLTFYFGNFISIGFYTRFYHSVFWVHQIVYIYRFLKKRVKNLNETLLQGLPVFKFDKQFQGLCCCLCLEQYNRIEPITKLLCHHNFHRNCIRIWVLKSNKCPLCRGRVVTY